MSEAQSSHSEIRDLVSRYAQGLDDRDIDAVLACFTDNASATYNGGKFELENPQALRTFYEANLIAPSTHLISNVLVEDRDGRVMARSSGVAFVTRYQGKVTLRGLVYEMECTLIGTTWKVRSLFHRVSWQASLSSEEVSGLPLEHVEPQE